MIVDNWDLKSVIAISCNGDINGLPLWSSNVAIIELTQWGVLTIHARRISIKHEVDHGFQHFEHITNI